MSLGLLQKIMSVKDEKEQQVLALETGF